MPKFIFAYHGRPDIQTKEDGAAHMEKWTAWSASLGDAVIDPGMALGASKTLTPDGIKEGGGSNPLSGISIVQADTLDDAVKLAAGCPHLSGTGTIEIAQDLEMDM